MQGNVIFFFLFCKWRRLLLRNLNYILYFQFNFNLFTHSIYTNLLCYYLYYRQKAYDISLFLGRYCFDTNVDELKNPLSAGLCYSVAGLIAVCNARCS
jgi:hypothetical protein